MRVDLIGIGMDGCRTLTKEASDAIRQADVLIGAKRMLDTVPTDDRKRFCAYETDKIAAFLQSCGMSRAAVLLSGDVGFFSGARLLRDALTEHDVRMLPGISSPVYFCARLAIPWESVYVVNLHGTVGNIAVHVRMHHRTFFLLGGQMTAAVVCRNLHEYGLGSVRIMVGERLGYPEENIILGTADKLLSLETDRLCVLIAENPDYLRYLPSCIPDREFLRSDVPMTKSAVRGAAVSSLHIAKEATCWDIGCGTGSVSVEMAFCCPEGRVCAVDKNETAVSLTKENARHFSCDHIRVLHGEAPAVLHDLPTPNCVFIGGTGGVLSPVFEMIFKANPSAAIAVTAVTLETLYEAQSAFQRYDGHYEITQLSVSPLRKIGSHTMFQAQNPVFLIAGVLR